MARAKRPCLTCGTPTDSSRCPQHRIPRPAYTETQRRAQAVRDWKRVHGDWCPGYQVSPHISDDLTADHVVPRSQGGELGPLTVLCRSCNSRRKDTAHPGGGSTT